MTGGKGTVGHGRSLARATDAKRTPSSFRWLVAVFLMIAALVTVGLSGVPPFSWVSRIVYPGDGLVSSLTPAPIGGEPVNILVIGSDDRSVVPEEGRFGHLVGERADLVLLVRIEAEQISLLHIPRDLRTESAALGVLPLAALLEYGGPGAVVDQIRSDLTVPVHHYVQVGFGGFVAIVDATGGVSIELDHPIRDEKSGLDLPAGDSNLTGAEALALVRARSAREFVSGAWRPLAGGDEARITRQQRVISSLVEAVWRDEDYALMRMVLPGQLRGLKRDRTLTLWALMSLASGIKNIDPGKVESFVLPTAPRRLESELVSPFQPSHLGGRLWRELIEPDAEEVLGLFRDDT